MTPFMLRVAELIGADGDPEPVPVPATRITRRIATSTGADRQIAVRALAEQLVCEANAVMAAGDEHLTLRDETLPHELAFAVGYRGRAARVSTTFENGAAFGHLVGDGFATEVPVELDGPDALPDLLIRLLAECGVTHHPMPAN